MTIITVIFGQHHTYLRSFCIEEWNQTFPPNVKFLIDNGINSEQLFRFNKFLNVVNYDDYYLFIISKDQKLNFDDHIEFYELAQFIHHESPWVQNCNYDRDREINPRLKYYIFKFNENVNSVKDKTYV
jgi:hypothetical protein